MSGRVPSVLVQGIRAGERSPAQLALKTWAVGEQVPDVLVQSLLAGGVSFVQVTGISLGVSRRTIDVLFEGPPGGVLTVTWKAIE